MRLRWFESTMDAANGLLHVFMALALLIASVLLIWQFAADVIQTLRSGQVAQGFLQALGNLFILWVLSSLISAEVRYMRSGRFSVLVFIRPHSSRCCASSSSSRWKAQVILNPRHGRTGSSPPPSLQWA